MTTLMMMMICSGGDSIWSCMPRHMGLLALVVVRFCRMHVIARGVCTHTVLGALPVTVSSGCEGDIGAHVHVTRSTCLVQGGEARDDELAFTELARYG